MMEFINWYLNSVSVFFDGVSAFFVSLAGGGLFQLILLWFLISCIFRRRWGWRHHGHGRCHCHHCRCSHCGCKCGHCPCGKGDDGDNGGTGTTT